ncbi:MAG: hypothetical protein QOJ19_4082, partial [Acidimicrobiia bacterium]|nr:hypothetical protein [Acidimicrobiia bacterium]
MDEERPTEDRPEGWDHQSSPGPDAASPPEALPPRQWPTQASPPPAWTPEQPATEQPSSGQRPQGSPTPWLGQAAPPLAQRRQQWTPPPSSPLAAGVPDPPPSSSGGWPDRPPTAAPPDQGWPEPGAGATAPSLGWSAPEAGWTGPGGGPSESATGWAAPTTTWTAPDSGWPPPPDGGWPPPPAGTPGSGGQNGPRNTNHRTVLTVLAITLAVLVGFFGAVIVRNVGSSFSRSDAAPPTVSRSLTPPLTDAPPAAGLIPDRESPPTAGGTAPTTPATPTPNNLVTGVVNITSTLGFQRAEASGTGIVLSADGQILTNNHVIKGATAIDVEVISTGKTYTASVVGTSPNSDIAVLKL